MKLTTDPRRKDDVKGAVLLVAWVAMETGMFYASIITAQALTHGWVPNFVLIVVFMYLLGEALDPTWKSLVKLLIDL